MGRRPDCSETTAGEHSWQLTRSLAKSSSASGFDDGETVDIAVVLDRELGEVDSGDFAADVGVSKADSNAVPEAREAVAERSTHSQSGRTSSSPSPSTHRWRRRFTKPSASPDGPSPKMQGPAPVRAVARSA